MIDICVSNFDLTRIARKILGKSEQGSGKEFGILSQDTVLGMFPSSSKNMQESRM